MDALQEIIRDSRKVADELRKDQDVLFEDLMKVQEGFQERLCMLETLVCLMSKDILKSRDE